MRRARGEKLQEEVKEDTVKHDGGVDASSLLPKRELMIEYILHMMMTCDGMAFNLRILLLAATLLFLRVPLP